MSAFPVAAAVLVVCLAAIVQGSVGIGGNLVAAPLLLLINPHFVPVPLLLALVARSALVAVRDRDGIAWDGVMFLSGGRLPGAALALALLGLIPARGFAIVFEILILMAVTLSVRSPATPRSGPVLVGVGVLTGFAATLTSVGGGFAAMLYRDVEAVRLRGTVAAAGAIGGVISLSALSAIGKVGTPQLLLGAFLLPGAIGVPISSVLARRIGARLLRPVVLVIVAISAASGLIHALAG